MWHSEHAEPIIGAAASNLWQSPHSAVGRSPAEWQRLHRIEACFPWSGTGCHGPLAVRETSPSGSRSPRTGRVWHTLQSVPRTRPLSETCFPSWQRKQPGQFRWPMLDG